METTYKGSAFTCGSQITAYQIIPQKYWDIENPDPSGESLGSHLFEDLLSADASPVPFDRKHASILVAGRNFGCGGKSIAQPVLALKYGGIRLVIAESISRYCYRNLVNLALPALVLPDARSLISSGDALCADLVTGVIANQTTGREFTCRPLSALSLDILAAGGALNFFCGSAQTQRADSY